MFSSNQPSICTSIRGLIYLDVMVESMNSDVHSGQLGGGVPNVIHYVSQLLSAMKDPVTNRVLIPGFYDDVGQYTGVTLSDDTVTKYLNELDQTLRIGRHANTDFFNNIWYQPTLDCNGFSAGFTDEGAKTVIPNVAQFKVSCRLVGDQKPQHMIDLVSSFIKSSLPNDFRIEINDFNTHAHPIKVDANSPYIQLALRALSETHGVDAIIQGEGGSIPVLYECQQILGVPLVMIGLNTPQDNIHAPNERFRLDDYKNGIDAIIRYFSYLGTMD